MISTKDLADDKTSYSTTRWAFVVAMKFAIAMAFLSLVAFIVFRVLGIDTDGLFSGVSTVLGIVVGLATTAKALQGFENGTESSKINAKIEVSEENSVK